MVHNVQFDKSVDLLVESYKNHVTDLQKEVERLQALVQVLSDDKFFKPQILPQDLGPTETTTPFEPTDFEFQTPTEDAAPEHEEDDGINFNEELSTFAKSFDAWRAKGNA